MAKTIVKEEQKRKRFNLVGSLNKVYEDVEDNKMLKPVKIQSNWTLKNQLAKIREEYSEVEILVLSRELGNSDITLSDIAEELVDVQTACETMLAMLGFDDEERNEVRQKVVEKNRERGYYDDFVNVNKMEE